MFRIFWEIRIPDVFTFLNLTFGFAGIYCVFTKPELSIIFLFIAVLMDGADGLLATSHGKGVLGKDLDSLADIVSFGVLPALLIALNSLLCLAIALIFLLSGILRLARFNVVNRENFMGYPITASALIIGSMVYLNFDFSYIASAALILSAFMVCDLEYLRIKDYLVLSVVAIVIVSSFIVKDAAYAILALTILYLLSPFPKQVMKWLERRRRRKPFLKRV
jgi:CDP-diacylglycerol--serine O-phosphatidyltransferase